MEILKYNPKNIEMNLKVCYNKNKEVILVNEEKVFEILEKIYGEIQNITKRLDINENEIDILRTDTNAIHIKVLDNNSRLIKMVIDKNKKL